ncbi:Wadjet anti-phage system protein JetD domain-containing protein [Clostridium drakei]|uniref:Wadjet protein JetD C-terminal domain-containing protein n=1 Tax=Clostridium drakei TaxID=332101 RepID=A0A2U8DPW6_9CLOT|nr:Wadjet anti-phage system protein JetD domain-containing protein [Clostridium drakei]AWI04511.1 hypothetical protein B9W14_08395 [Clostridium drakei]
MYQRLINYLKSYKKATITLGELENLVPGNYSYNTFAESIMQLIDDNILIKKNPKITNGKEVPLPYKFGINKYELRREHIDNIQRYALNISEEIDLQEYFNLSEEVWNKDLPYIHKINEYIEKNGLPKDYVTPQERSFNIAKDEKWIAEKGGKKLLERIKLWEKLNIIDSTEPLMLAVNPRQFSKAKYCHLVVENKATFMALLDVLQDTEFTSLIFGSGWKIVGNINMLNRQLGIKGTSRIFYFGDLDNEGISIWNSLNEKVCANLAVEFYRELIKKPYSQGKETQQKNDKALKNFTSFFYNEEKTKLEEILKNGGYLPQEALNKDELGHIWRNTKWV